MTELHTVHMVDGTKKLCTPAELEALDPATWHAQECPRLRFEVRPNVLSPETTHYSVYDREDNAQVKSPLFGYTTEDKNIAQALAQELNNGE